MWIIAHHGNPKSLSTNQYWYNGMELFSPWLNHVFWGYTKHLEDRLGFRTCRVQHIHHTTCDSVTPTFFLVGEVLCSSWLGRKILIDICTHTHTYQSRLLHGCVFSYSIFFVVYPQWSVIMSTINPKSWSLWPSRVGIAHCPRNLTFEQREA